MRLLTGNPVLDALHALALAAWLVMAAYWLIAARSAAPSADATFARRGLRNRTLVALGIILIASIADRLSSFQKLRQAEFHSVPMASIGLVLIVAGTFLAIWSRRTLGRNWGMPGARKLDTDLVTAGPYARIRHPIYTAMFLMMAGTAIAIDPIWWGAMLMAGPYLLLNARSEEALMIQRFPSLYPAYRARTRMIVPYVL